MTAQRVGRTTGEVGGTADQEWLWSALDHAERLGRPPCSSALKLAALNGSAVTEMSSFPAVPASVKAARDFAVTALRAWGLPTLTDEVCLVVSELVTNALHHATPPRSRLDPEAIRLSLIRRGDEVICAVRDSGADIPFRKDPHHIAETGRGLMLVESFSSAWGWTPLRDSGKVVWALFTDAR